MLPRLPAFNSLTLSVGLIAVLFSASPAGAQSSFQELRQENAPASEAEAAFDEGDYDRAQRLALRHDDAASLLIRARLALFDGELGLATRFAEAAVERAASPQRRARAQATYAHLLKSAGQWDEAEEELRGYLAEHAKAHPVRLELGRLLLDRGKKAEADVVLDEFSRFFNNGQLDTARKLRWLGEAMQAIGSFDDANYAFERMYEKDNEDVDGLVVWAELLLSKYNTADAERTLKEALALNPRHPDALVAMARLEMETKNYFDDARALLDQAEAVAPANPEMLSTRAELAIYGSDCPRATETADAILKTRPKYLDAFVIQAACRFLDDDQQGFEAAREKALAIKPDFARLYTATAEYAQFVHRYVEVVELNRKALELEPDYAPALLGLGIGLSRIGREDEGVLILKKAFDADPYNVRAFNMVELYEQTMPDYELTAYDAYQLRTHRKQTGPLNVLLPPLVSEAMATFTQKYDHEVQEGLSVEIYPNSSTFGVRSVGLPSISPHGICFGRVVIARSPSDGNFNWRQVVWHELAHVYHIQKANYRVPRWFTEGLAEYETNIKDPAWIRHHDRDITAMIEEDELPSVVELDKGFTQARAYQEILRAYHLSSLVIHYIVEEYGFDTINAMLVAFADQLDTGKVIEAVVGEDVEAFDQAFEAWLRKRYSNFKNQFVVSVDNIEAVHTLEEKLDDTPRDAVLHAKLAAAKLRQGNAEEATDAIDRALSLAPENPTVRFFAASVALGEGRARDAYAHAIAILDTHLDGYELRVALGQIAMMLENTEAARVHLEAATQLYTDGSEAWMSLLKLAQSQGDEELAERAEGRLFELDQNDPQIARKRLARMIDAGRFEEALAAAERWVAIQPLEPRPQRALAEASLAADRAERAIDAYEVLVRLLPEERRAVLEEAARALADAGFHEQAKCFAERAAKLTDGDAL